MTHETRESWLNAVAQGMALLFEALDAPLPDRVRVAIGFTSRGAKGKAIGECWDNRLSADGHFEIFIRPDLAHAPDAMPAATRLSQLSRLSCAIVFTPFKSPVRRWPCHRPEHGRPRTTTGGGGSGNLREWCGRALAPTRSR